MFKFIHRYVRGRWERYYLKSHWHLVLDLSMLIIIIMLAAGLIGFYVYRPNIIFSDYNQPTVDLNNPPLTLDFSGVSSASTLLKGTPLQISYKNNGNLTVNNLTFDFITTDNNFLVDHVTLGASGSPATVVGREVVLPKVSPGAGGEVNLQVYFSAKNSAARTINWQVQSQYFLSGQLLKITYNLPAINISANISVDEGAYYTSPQGDQLGVGPIPPIVGVPTSYWIFWSVSSNGDFKNMVVNARLPQGTELGTGRSLLAGDFNYTTSTRQLIWKLPELKAGNDSSRLGFEVRIIPNASQVGQVLPLLTGAQYYAEDSLTGESRSGNLPNLTTNLDSDRFNVGQGKVINQ